MTRGIHAEPWDKLISVACGRVFGAWVDLNRRFDRPGLHLRARPVAGHLRARGVGNSYQALEDGTAYTYLVNAQRRRSWSPRTPS